MRLLVLVLAAAAFTVGPAQATRVACNHAAGRAAIASTHLRMTLLGDSSTRVDPRSGVSFVVARSWHTKSFRP